jgi:hypothetical protein
VTPRTAFIVLVAAIALGAVAFVVSWSRFPSDQTPEGAYHRIVKAVNRGRPEEFFAYLETASQHACFTIRNYRRKSSERIAAAYPEPERSRRLKEYAAVRATVDGADVFTLYAEERGWLDALRSDLSGIAHVEVDGPRATIETARGTRYSFRRRENGLWGLTRFTSELVAEAERAARDDAMVANAAADYVRVRRASAAKASEGPGATASDPANRVEPAP